MRRWSLLLGLVALTCGSARTEAFGWDDLWERPDQQGERALRAGHAAAAAALFQDPRRRAYAELEAGQLAAAAKRLEPLPDPQSRYNRGNALARSGDLEGALRSYDAALAAAPSGSPLARDARHNRDLVAAQLRRQPPPGGRANRAGGNPSAPGQSPQQDPGQQNSGASNPSAQNSGMNQSAEQNSASGQSGLGQANSPDAHSGQANAGPGSGGASADRDSRESQAAAAARLAGGPSDAGHAASGQDAGVNALPGQGQRARAPESEQAMARDQWLRQIPDDPGGLLRRKFLIEHLIREREAERGDSP